MINKDLADHDIRTTLQWFSDEKERIGNQLTQENVRAGLDANRAAYAQLHEEFARRMKAIGEKYDLHNEESS